MYLPSMFAQNDRAKLLAHARENPFATVITGPDGDIAVSHLPLLVDETRGVLRGHLARENPQHRHFARGTPALAVFHGPHGYVSPTGYLAPGVPTWNYVVVHVRGPSRLLESPGLQSVLDDSVARFDSAGWRMDPKDEVLQKKLLAISGFEIDIAHLEGKWKLSQNRSPEERERVIAWLEKGDDASQATAALMRELSSPRAL
jgi:transcriptional regulator